MNREDWDKLTKKEQRIKVADLCGWIADINDVMVDRRLFSSDRPLMVAEAKCRYYLHDDKGYLLSCVKYDDLPDYLYDLNEMYEVIEDLTFDQKVQWSKWLGKICRTSKSQYPTY